MIEDFYMDKMIELDADGIDFIPFDEAFMKRDYLRCNIICSYSKLDWEKVNKSIPKTPYLFWKIIDGVKVYCS